MEIKKEEDYTSTRRTVGQKGGNSKFPTNEEIRLALKDKDLYNIQPKNRSYFFELLENHNNKEYVDTSNEAITIEHIFPKTPTEEWKKQLTLPRATCSLGDVPTSSPSTSGRTECTRPPRRT